MPNDRGLIRTTHKNQLRLRTKRELRITPDAQAANPEKNATTIEGMPVEIAIEENLAHGFVRPDDSASQVGEQVPQIIDLMHQDVASDLITVASGESCTSFTSAASTEGHCYVPNTVIKDVNGRFVLVTQLQLFDYVYGAGGEQLQITFHKVHPPQLRDLVTLKTQDACICVTGTHYVMVRRGGEQVRARADSLKVGDDMVCSSGIQRLCAIDRTHEKLEVVQLAFQPDAPVEMVNMPVNAILTRGYSAKNIRRGRKPKNKQLANAANDEISVQDTYDSFDP
jgi:hypothetical protein